MWPAHRVQASAMLWHPFVLIMHEASLTSEGSPYDWHHCASTCLMSHVLNHMSRGCKPNALHMFHEQVYKIILAKFWQA